MTCPKCEVKMKCVETRHRHLSTTYRRYRCPECFNSYSSMERLDTDGELIGRNKKRLSAAEIHWRLTHPGQERIIDD